jgi:hypothetical protein
MFDYINGNAFGPHEGIQWNVRPINNDKYIQDMIDKDSPPDVPAPDITETSKGKPAPVNNVWHEHGGAEVRDFPIIGGQVMRYLYVRGTGKYYRHIRVTDNCGGGKDTIWPGPATENLDDYEVPESVIGRLNRVKRGGIELPSWIVDAFDMVAAVGGLNEEVGLAMLAWALGEEGSKEEREDLLSSIYWTIGIIAAVATVGIAVSAIFPGAGAAALAGAVGVGRFLLKGLVKLARKFAKEGGWVASKMDTYLRKVNWNESVEEAQRIIENARYPALKGVKCQAINPGNLKVQSTKWLKKQGINAEALKKDFVGRGGARWNIAIGEDGLIYLVPVQRGGSGLPQATGLSPSDAAAIYPN